MEKMKGVSKPGLPPELIEERHEILDGGDQGPADPEPPLRGDQANYITTLTWNFTCISCSFL